MTIENSYVPDSQIVFPSVFFSESEKIGYPSCMYRDCFNLLKRGYNYVLMPSNQTDFSNLILRKFNKFLENIEIEIQKAREQKTQEATFYAKTQGRLRSIDAFERHLGDLMQFWEAYKEFFWSLVGLDYVLARKKLTQLANSKIAEFTKICEGHLVEFSEEEQKLSEKMYNLIKESKDNRSIQHTANNEDLLILADCFIYKTKRILNEYMYLITDDNQLYGTTTEIIAQPRLIFPDFEPSERFIGFEPLRPRKFITNCRAKSK